MFLTMLYIALCNDLRNLKSHLERLKQPSAHPDFNQLITGIDITAFVNDRENWNHDSEKMIDIRFQNCESVWCGMSQEKVEATVVGGLLQKNRFLSYHSKKPTFS